MRVRARVFGNRILIIFGSKRDYVTGRWRKLHMRCFVTFTLCQLELSSQAG
jgi:hypothetical protein